MNGSTKRTGTFSVDDPYTWNMSQIRIIQIFIQMGDRLIYGHADQIDLGTDRCRLGYSYRTVRRLGAGMEMRTGRRVFRRPVLYLLPE